MNFIEKAGLLQKESKAIYKELNISKILGEVGKVYELGSSRFGLQVNTNLDLECYMPKLSIIDAFSAVAKIAQNQNIVSAEYHNFIDFDDSGIYWLLNYKDASNKLWTIDLWFVTPEHPFAYHADKFASAMEKALNDDYRHTILKIKSELPADMTVRGIDVYRAVMRDLIRDTDSFLKWYEAQNLIDLEPWIPGDK
jgi:hypothetical protein